MSLQTHMLTCMFRDQELRISMYEVGYSEAELKLKCKQARDNPLAKNGTNQHLDLTDRVLDARDNPLCEHGKADRGVDNVKPTKGGNDTDYTLRRLARDNPEMLDAIESCTRVQQLSWKHHIGQRGRTDDQRRKKPLIISKVLLLQQEPPVSTSRNALNATIRKSGGITSVHRTCF
jgi:hypothetical protein